MVAIFINSFAKKADIFHMTIYRSLAPLECASRSDKYVFKLFAENLLSQEWTWQVMIWLAWMCSETY